MIHHTQCGAGALADDAFRGRSPSGSEPMSRSYVSAPFSIPSPTVTHDVGLIQSASAISQRVAVSGHVTTSSTAW